MHGGPVRTSELAIDREGAQSYQVHLRGTGTVELALAGSEKEDLTASASAAVGTQCGWRPGMVPAMPTWSGRTALGETVKVSVPYGLLDPDAHERTGHDSRAFQRDEVT